MDLRCFGNLKKHTQSISSEQLKKMAQTQLQQNMAQPHLQQWPQTQPSVNSNATLKGTRARVASGLCLIITGVVEVIIACILVARPTYFCGLLDKISWGIWGGVFAIITGCFGCFSRRSRCVVIAFLVLGIIQAVISGCVTIVYGGQAACGGYEKGLNFALYILMCIICAFQMLMSIIGASFTCIVICHSSGPVAQQVILYQPAGVPLQPTGVQGPYPVATAITNQLPFDNSYGQQNPPPYNQCITTQYQPSMK